jgi:hypothetical protein
MKYDFVEIGTSNFATLIESATDATVGLSIEPIRSYLDQLPNRPGVKKLNCAVSRTNQNEMLEVYYVTEADIIKHQLPDWLRGCNAVGEYHFQHTALEIEHLVQKQLVPCVPIGHVFDQNDISELAFLKIDTEGSDCAIMLHLSEYLKTQPVTRYPKKIMFESNELAVPAQIEQVKKKFVALGYRITLAGYDTIVEI